MAQVLDAEDLLDEGILFDSHGHGDLAALLTQRGNFKYSAII